MHVFPKPSVFLCNLLRACFVNFKKITAGAGIFFHIRALPGLMHMPDNQNSSSSTSLTKAEKVFLLFCSGLYLVPIWAFKYFPTQDGPVHLENVMVLSQYFGPVGDIWRQYYTINTCFVPTWLGHLAFCGLMQIIPPLFAEKIFLTIYIVGMISAFYYCVRSLDRSSGFCVVLIFPFLYNHLFHMGFYSFSCSFILYLVLIGYFFRHGRDFGVLKTGVFFFLTALLYLLHPFSFAMAVLFVVPVVFLDICGTRNTADDNRSGLKRIAPAVTILLGMIPLILFARGKPAEMYQFPDFLQNLTNLLIFSSLASFDYKEYIWIFLFGLALFFLLIKSGKSLFSGNNEYRNVAAIMVLYVLMYFFLPNYLFGGGYISSRLGLFIYLVLILWISANHKLWNFRAGIQICIYLISIGLLTTHFIRYIELNDYLQEYVSTAQYMCSGKTVLPLRFAHVEKGMGKTDPFLHAAGYVSLDRRVIDFSNYEAKTGYFPLVFRPQLNPDVHLGKTENLPPSPLSLEFAPASGGNVDYILTWGRKGVAPDARVDSIMKYIEERFDLLYVSSPGGLAELWRNKNLTEHRCAP